MIGQCNLQSRIGQLIEDNTFPRFSILVGPKGSGKKTFVHEVLIKEITDGLYEECGIKVDDVRNLIADAYKIHSLAVYFIPDADNMSNAAKNALLKVTEEPPNNAYFIMTLEDENNTLETIRSRATIFHMDRYTPDEIYQYAKEFTNYTLHDNERDIIKDVCETPGDVNNLGKYPREFYDYVQLVVDNISEVSLANALKISEKIAMKDESDKYDLKLFWRAFQSVCIDRANDGIIYCEYAAATSEYMKKLRIRGINKQMLFDNWIFTIREIIYDGRRVKSRSQKVGV